MGTTPTYALPYPELTEAANVPADMRELAERVEAVLPAPAAVMVTRQAALTLAGTTQVTVPFDTIDIRVGFTSAAGVQTAQVAGNYWVTSQLQFPGQAGGGYRQLRMLRNGALVAYQQGPVDAAQVHTVTVSLLMSLAVGDTIAVAYFGAAGPLSVTSPYKLNTLSIARIVT